MIRDPSISVVIPCYNAAKYIRSAIESVQAQTYPAREIICVDDGSVDDTLLLLQAMQQEGYPIRIRAQANAGASAARNTGLSEVTSQYVQFLDADDLLQATKLEHQAELILASDELPDIIAASAFRHPFDEPENVTLEDILPPDEWSALIDSKLGTTCSNLSRVETVNRVGGWNETVSQGDDADLLFRMLCEDAKVIWDEKPLTVVRRRRDSLWKHDKAASTEAWLRIRRRILEYLDKEGLLTEERLCAIQDNAFRNIRNLYRIDKDLAIDMHNAIIRKDFRPDMGRPYRTIYRRFGLEVAERFHCAKLTQTWRWQLKRTKR